MNKNNLKPYILLSILPLVYLSNTLEIALFMGITFIMLAAIVYGAGVLIDKFSVGRMRLYTYILLVAVVITMTMTILDTYFSLNQFMGIYLALTIFTIPQLKAQTSEIQKPMDYLWVMLISFVALILIGFLREFLGTGSITLAAFGVDTIQVFASRFGIGILIDNSGGFILAGFIFAIIQAIPFVKEEPTDVV